jgi:hypothetical protein
MFIHRLLYRSDSSLAGSPKEVERQIAAIVDSSRAANAAAGLTGALLFESGTFMQVLEVPLNAVEATFERICGDLRHRRVRLLEFAVAEDRIFGAWEMARVAPGPELAELNWTTGVTQEARLDVAAASAAVRTMRDLLLPTRAASTRPRPSAAS